MPDGKEVDKKIESIAMVEKDAIASREPDLVEYLAPTTQTMANFAGDQT